VFPSYPIDGLGGRLQQQYINLEEVSTGKNRTLNDLLDTLESNGPPYLAASPLLLHKPGPVLLHAIYWVIPVST
jgi:hypothetical protein